MWAALFLMVVIVGGGYKFWNYYKFRDQYRAIKNYNALVEMMKNDVYGGATPEETLKMFVEALKAGDVEKASLYFVLDETGSREKWVTALRKDKEGGGLAEIITVFSQAKLSRAIENKTYYEVLNDRGVTRLSIVLLYNGKVWKIESL